jgi:hypothetical protein
MTAIKNFISRKILRDGVLAVGVGWKHSRALLVEAIIDLLEGVCWLME